jgi:hypothetical protein
LRQQLLRAAGAGLRQADVGGAAVGIRPFDHPSNKPAEMGFGGATLLAPRAVTQVAVAGLRVAGVWLRMRSLARYAANEVARSCWHQNEVSSPTAAPSSLANSLHNDEQSST